MRATLSLLTLVLAFPLWAGTIVIEGHYQGRNVFIQNPFSEAGVGFCVFEVTVNGQIATDEINSSAFEVDMNNFGLKLGDAVVLKINHKDGCTPVVLNPEVLRPRSTFDIVKQSISSDGKYTWTATNETGELPYIVEQKRWNKWVKVGEVMGRGKPGEHAYSFQVTPHSGENTFRVKQVDMSRRARISENVSYAAQGVAAVTWGPQKPKDEITFTANTMYEIYDEFGNIVKRGTADRVDVSNLKRGTYYLNYDNKTGETFLKR